MKELILQNKEIFYSIITAIVILIFRFGINKGVRRIGIINDFNNVRTALIIKYLNILFIFIASIAGSVIWGVDFEKLGLIFSSIFAILGVALFAQWSILSNVTAGFILFFSFPFKIGDKIRIQDKDFPTDAVIEDIKAFHVHLRTDEGELITYPNNLFLQKGIVVLHLNHLEDDGSESV